MNTLVSMVNRNVRNQYRNSVLGILWTVLNPLLNMLVIAFVFWKIFGRDNMDGLYYPVYILSGNIVFGLLRTSTSNSLTCIVNNYGLLSKTRLAHEIFPISNVLSATVNFFFSMIALFLVMLVSLNKPGIGFHFTLLLTIVPFLPFLILFCLGISFILATIYIRFRDIQHIYTVLLTLWMYLTPLFYSLSMDNLKDHKRTVEFLKLNPMYHYVTYFRQILLGNVPSLVTHLILFAWGVGMCLIGFLFFHFSKKKFLLYI